nr:complement C4-like [Dromaius novaehollandiae]
MAMVILRPIAVHTGAYWWQVAVQRAVRGGELLPQSTVELTVTVTEPGPVTVALGATDGAVLALDGGRQRLSQDKGTWGTAQGRGLVRGGLPCPSVPVSPAAACPPNPARRRRSLELQKLLEEEEEMLDMMPDEELLEDDLPTRSFFPESWLWRSLRVNGSERLSVPLPDSITTWEIQAIAIIPGYGVCVAAPLRLQVTQDLHVGLRLPYSARPREQLQPRALLHSRLPQDVNVTVSLSVAAGVCAALAEGPQHLEVPAGAVVAMPFTLVALGPGDIPITITARGPWGFGDRITRILHVKAEGELHLEETSYVLDTDGQRGWSLQIPGDIPADVVPDGDFSMSVRVSGARGRGRDEDAGMGGRGDTGMGGCYERIQSFRKDDGSYAGWRHRPSSTWLSALVLRVLSGLRRWQQVDEAGLRATTRWLLRQQGPSGAFRDPQPIIHRRMQGGMAGAEAAVALTAFVAVALHQARDVHGPEHTEQQQLLSMFHVPSPMSVSHVHFPYLMTHVHVLCLYPMSMSHIPWPWPRPVSPIPWPRLVTVPTPVSMEQDAALARAAGFLRGRMEMAGPFAAAIGTYALALSDTPGSPEPLLRLARSAHNGSAQFWPAGGAAETVEATGYGLLALLRLNDVAGALRAARWLREQSNYGGGFHSTQDTVVALEALSELWLHSPQLEELGLDVTFVWPRGPGRHSAAGRTQVTLRKGLEHVERKLEVPLGSPVTVQVKGEGQGTLTVSDRPDTCVPWGFPHDLHFPPCPSMSPHVPHVPPCPPHPQVPPQRDCVTFGVTQEVAVGLLQPAAATIFDYYEPERRCTVFYSAPRRSSFVATLCSPGVCECAEGACPRAQRPLAKELTAAKRLHFACNSPRVDYALVVEVQGEGQFGAFVGAETKIVEVLQSGPWEAAVGQQRRFLVRGGCRLRLRPQRRYLLMGRSGPTRDPHGR